MLNQKVEKVNVVLCTYFVVYLVMFTDFYVKNMQNKRPTFLEIHVAVICVKDVRVHQFE
jgi:hypothetical protein